MAGLEKYQIFVELAQEILQHEPEVAYYVLFYYVNKGMELLSRDQTNQALRAEVIGKLEQLETMKKSLGDPVNKETYEGFLTLLFCQVDTEDRQEGSTGATAKKFRNCAKLIEAWSGMGPVPAEWEKKKKYCLWKAADIVKSLKAKQPPRRGGPDDEVPLAPAPNSSGYTQMPTDVYPAPQGAGGFNPPPPQQEFHSGPPQTQFPPIPQREAPQAPQTGGYGAPQGNPFQQGNPYAQGNPFPQGNPYQPGNPYPQQHAQPPQQGNQYGGPTPGYAVRGVKLTRDQVRMITAAIKSSTNALQELEFKKIREAKELIQQALQQLSGF